MVPGEFQDSQDYTVRLCLEGNRFFFIPTFVFVCLFSFSFGYLGTGILCITLAVLEFTL